MEGEEEEYLKYEFFYIFSPENVYVYVDDFHLIVLLFLLKFSDDTKNAGRIKSRQDADRFQRDIDGLCKWANNWAMEFNTEKCKIMHIGRKNPRYKYYMNGVELSVTEEERDRKCGWRALFSRHSNAPKQLKMQTECWE